MLLVFPSLFWSRQITASALVFWNASLLSCQFFSPFIKALILLVILQSGSFALLNFGLCAVKESFHQRTLVSSVCCRLAGVIGIFH